MQNSYEEVPRKKIDVTLIKSHLVSFRGNLNFLLMSEIRIKYEETVPFCNIQNNFILRIISKFPV